MCRRVRGLLICNFFMCMHECLCVCACVRARMCMHAGMLAQTSVHRGHSLMFGCLPQLLLHLTKKSVYSLNLELTSLVWVDWLASECLGPACLCSSAIGGPAVVSSYMDTGNLSSDPQACSTESSPGYALHFTDITAINLLEGALQRNVLGFQCKVVRKGKSGWE